MSDEYSQTIYRTVIPAQPGWYVISGHLDKETGEIEVFREGIIGWVVEGDQSKYGDKSVFYDPRPITAEQGDGWHHVTPWIEQPDGAIFCPLDYSFHNREEWLAHIKQGGEG